VPVRGGAFQLDGAWPPGCRRASSEDDSHPSKEAGLRVVDLGQASKKGDVAIVVVPCHVAAHVT
jgi:hypothetical protein